MTDGSSKNWHCTQKEFQEYFTYFFVSDDLLQAGIVSIYDTPQFLRKYKAATVSGGKLPVLYTRHCRHPHSFAPKMSFVAPYSSSIVAVLPVLTAPQLESKRMVLHGTVASPHDSTVPIMVSYWPGSEPRAAALDDTVLISASVRFTASNGTVTAISDASFVNVLVEAERADLLDPASDCTAVFFLTGMVLSDLPAKREFILETGSWSPEVWRLLI